MIETMQLTGIAIEMIIRT